MIDKFDKKILIEKAIESRENSYAPYSGFKVGASLLTKEGKIFSGCNIENSAFSPSLCAERVAFAKAISEGEKDFVAIAIMGGKDELQFCPPCGVCRQVMVEFVDPDEFQIVLSDGKEIRQFSLADLTPSFFSKTNLK